MGYEEKLNRVLDDLFTRADKLGISLPSLADKAGLAYTTVLRINTYETRLPRFKSILALARAVDMDLILVSVVAQRKKGAA